MWKRFPPFLMLLLRALGSRCLSHPRRQRISGIYHGSFITLYLCLQTPTLVAGAFQVQGPHEPLVVTLGGEAELTCYLLPSQSVRNMQIIWTRSEPSQVVHLYKNGRDQPGKAMKEYVGRTKLVRNAMHKGIVGLRIFNVQPSDNGQYRCGFQHDSSFKDTVIELQVAVLGSNPHFHVVTTPSEMRVECKSEGWFPQPTVQWMDSQGAEIPAETHTKNEGGLFSVTTSQLFSKTSQKNLTCSIWNPVLKQKKKEQLSIEVTADRSSPFFIATIVLAVLILLIAAGVAVRLYRGWHKNRSVTREPDYWYSKQRIEQNTKENRWTKSFSKGKARDAAIAQQVESLPYNTKSRDQTPAPAHAAPYADLSYNW